jgi:hypothetical protein
MFVVVCEEREGRFLGWLRGWAGGQEGPEEGAQKPGQPAQEEVEVVAGGGAHSVGSVAVASLR